MQCLGVPRVLKMLRDDLAEAEVNWKHLLMAVSTFVVCFKEARKHVKTLVGALIEESLTSKNKETLASAFLIVRQCCAETEASFPSYAIWFGLAFSSDMTSAEFKFLLQFLQELVPIEPAYCLRAHISKPPSTPSGLHHITAEYTASARSRLAATREDSTPSLLGNDSLDQDIDQVVKHFRSTGNVYPALLSAANLLRQPFERELVPRLVAGGHSGVVARLVKMGRLTEQQVERLTRRKQAEMESKKRPSEVDDANKEDDALETAKTLLSGAAEKLRVTCDLQGNLDKVVASLAEKLPITDRKELEFAREFGLKYLSLAEQRSELSTPQVLVKKAVFASDRLQYCDQSDLCEQGLCAGAELSLSEWLDFESAVTAEFLQPSAYRLYLSNVREQHPDLREMLTLLIEKMLELPDNGRLVAAASGLVSPVRSSELGGKETPVLLDLWSKLSFTHSHEDFFSIAQALPEWLLFTNALSSRPTPQTIQTLAELINDDLLEVLSGESLLLPGFVSHLMVGFNEIRSACGADVARVLLDSLLDLCPALYLAVLVYFRNIRRFLEPLFTRDCDATRTTRLGKLKVLLAMFKTPGSKFTLEPCVQFLDSWETAAIFWFHGLKNNQDRAKLEDQEAQIAKDRNVCRWLFFFRAIDLGHALNEGRAVFKVTNGQLCLAYDAHESPLRALESHLRVDTGVVSMLLGNGSIPPFNMFPMKTMRLVSSVGLLFLVERRRSNLVVASTEILGTLPALRETFFATLAKGVEPDFLAKSDVTDIPQLTERRELLEYVRKACHEMIGEETKRPSPIPSLDSGFYVIGDDDFFEIPDDLP